jgi:hypothetical protein
VPLPQTNLACRRSGLRLPSSTVSRSKTGPAYRSSLPRRSDLPSMAYIIYAMYEIDLEPEVEAWLLDLPYSYYQRVMRNVDDYLVTGGVPDGDHVKKLQDADDVYELRVALDRTTWRISFWKPGAGSSSC